MSVSLQKYAENYFGKYLMDSSINEICYNGDNFIWFQNDKGIWECETTNITFENMEAFASASAAFKESQVDKSRPILSCTLVTGERVQIVLPPATKKDHISVTIRKPSRTRFMMSDFSKQGLFSEIEPITHTLSQKDNELLGLYENREYESFVSKAVKYGKNVIICGETGSGKTTFMKSLIDFIPLESRLISIEDVEEIVFFTHKNFVQLFYPSEAKSDDFLNSATLLKSCLRMKPDRILLAELRGAETFDFINVLSSGHGGSLTSCHAGSSKDCFKRLAMMMLQNPQGQKIPYDQIMAMLHDLIDVIIHIYAHNGKRRISEVYFKVANDLNLQ